MSRYHMTRLYLKKTQSVRLLHSTSVYIHARFQIEEKISNNVYVAVNFLKKTV